MNENGTAQPVTDRAQLIEWFAERGKPKSAWRIGTEHEKFLFRKDSFKPVAYEGGQGVGELLRLLEEQYDMQPIIEKGLIIGLKRLALSTHEGRAGSWCRRVATSRALDQSV